MVWPLAVMAGSSFIKGLLGADAQDTQIAMQRKAIAEENQWAANQNIADNKAIAEANLQNTIRTALRVGLNNVMRGQARKELLAQGVMLSSQRSVLAGTNNANAAASGTIGSSVEAVAQDIDVKIGEARAQLDANNVQQEFNFDQQVQDIVRQGQDALRSPTSTRYRKMETGGYSSTAGVLFGALASAGSTYAASYMNLGLGSKVPTPSPVIGTGITSSGSVGFKPPTGAVIGAHLG